MLTWLAKTLHTAVLGSKWLSECHGTVVDRHGEGCFGEKEEQMVVFTMKLIEMVRNV